MNVSQIANQLNLSYHNAAKKLKNLTTRGYVRKGEYREMDGHYYYYARKGDNPTDQVFLLFQGNEISLSQALNFIAQEPEYAAGNGNEFQQVGTLFAISVYHLVERAKDQNRISPNAVEAKEFAYKLRQYYKDMDQLLGQILKMPIWDDSPFIPAIVGPLEEELKKKKLENYRTAWAKGQFHSRWKMNWKEVFDIRTKKANIQDAKKDEKEESFTIRYRLATVEEVKSMTSSQSDWYNKHKNNKDIYMTEWGVGELTESHPYLPEDV